jgi:CheY-like chemotaxis protein
MKKRIMVVDDEPDQIYTIKQILDDCEVIGAESGMKCLEILKSNKIPDLIILDIMMPGLSGWETFERVRDNPEWKEIPIIFLTARTDRIARNAGRFLGNDYIEKPFDVEEFKRRVEKFLRGDSP